MRMPTNRDQWGYTETAFVWRLLSTLSAIMNNSFAVFRPIVAERDDGVAKFRENATKTNSLVDRLESLTLPVISTIWKTSSDRYLKIERKSAMIF